MGGLAGRERQYNVSYKISHHTTHNHTTHNHTTHNHTHTTIQHTIIHKHKHTQTQLYIFITHTNTNTNNTQTEAQADGTQYNVTNKISHSTATPSEHKQPPASSHTTIHQLYCLKTHNHTSPYRTNTHDHDTVPPNHLNK